MDSSKLGGPTLNVRIRSNNRAARPRLVTPLFLRVQLSTFAYFTSVGALLPTLPRYVEGPLGGGSVAVGVVVGMFALSAVLLRPVAGRLGDRRGRRLLIVAGAALVAVSVAAYAAAANLSTLLVLRLVSGIGEAAFYTGAASVINDLAPNERRGEALSYFSLALFAGLAVGPVIAEYALAEAGYTSAWLVSAVAAAIAAVLGLRVPDTRPEGAEAPETSATRIVHPAGLLPGTVLAANVWGLATFTSFVPLYALQLGMKQSGIVFATQSVILILMRSLGARIPDRIGVTRAAPLALAGTALGLAVIGLWVHPVGLFVGTAIFAVGHALAFPALMTMAVSSAPVSERGAVVGTFTAFFDLAFGLGAVSAGAVAALLGYEGAFISAALVAGAGLVLLSTRARKRRAQERERVLAAVE